MASGSAGSIYVDLLLRDSNYVSGLGKARSYTSKETKAMSASFNALKGVIGGLSAGALFSKFISNTINAQNEQAQLATIIRSTGGAAGYTVRQLNMMADSLSRNSIFSSGEINNAQTRLLSYAGILGENIPRAMQSVIDQSARLGISVESSAETIGRALEQPSKAAAALSRQGFGSYFTKETIDMLKALEEQGRMAEAQVKILEVLEESYAGAAEAARNTLGGALKNLNNQFNDMLTGGEGINALSSAINLLASNLDLIAKIGAGVATFFAVKYVASIGAAVISTAAMTAGTLRLQLALGAMSGYTAAATTGILGLTVALRGVSALIAVIGGPIGAAAIGAFFMLRNATNAASDAQVVLSDNFMKINSSIAQYSYASKDLKDQIRADVLARISAYQAELLTLDAIANRLDSENFIFRGARNIGSKLGIDTSASDVRNVYAQITEEIERLKNTLDGFDNPSSSVGFLSEEEKKKRDKAQKELNSSYERYEHLIRGISKEALNLETVERELNNLRLSGRISQDEMTSALDRYVKELNRTGREMDEFAKSAARNIQTAFADFLFDPFDKGVKGMAKGFIDSVRRMIAEAQAAKLARSLFGDTVEGGTGSGILGSALSGLGKVFDGFFATGGFIQPGHFGIAGENGPEIIMGGNTGKTVIPMSREKTGGNTYYIDARGADQSAVARLEQSLLALAGPGVIEQRVSNAQVRGML